MYCPSCGSLNDGTLLCMTCGRELGDEPKRAPRAEPAIEPSTVGVTGEPVQQAAPPAPAPALEHPCPVHPELPVGGTCSRCGKFVCIRCAPKLAEGSSLCTDCIARQPAASDAEGIGGWLVLPAITVVLTPLAGVVMAFGALVAGEFLALLLGGLLAGYGGFTAFNFFSRTRQAPLLMIGFYSLSIIANLLMNQAPASAGWGVVWIIYFLRSERVKRTFVR